MNTSTDLNTKIYQDNDYSQRLNSTTNETKLATGAGGGSSVVVDNDSLIGTPLSEEGLQHSSSLDRFTYGPMLPAVDQELYNSVDSGFAQSFVEYLAPFLGMDANSSIGSLIQKQNGSDGNEDLAFIRSATEEYGLEDFSPNSPMLQKMDNSAKSSLEEDPVTAHFQKLIASISDQETMSEKSEAILKGFSSTNSQKVTEILIQESGFIDTKHISPALLNEFQRLGAMIAEVNSSGENSILNIAVPELLHLSFLKSLDLSQNPTLNREQKELLSKALYTAAQKISSANLEKITTRESADPEYTRLTSGNEEEVSAVINSFIEGIDLSGLTETEQAALQALTISLASKSFAPDVKMRLLSNDPIVVQNALEIILGGSFALSPFFMQTLLPAIASGMGGLNEVELQKMLKSSSPESIELALGVLSGVATSTTMEPQAKKIVLDYLKVLTDALVFMAQIRSLITRLEGAFTQAIAAAKTASISEQIKNAMELYLMKADEVNQKYIENAKKIEKAKLLKIFMPIIAILLLVVAIIMIVVSLVGTVATGGASLVGLALVAKIIALVVALVVTSAVLIYTVVDAISTWSTGKGILERAFADEPESKRSALIMAVNLAITIGTAVLTFGVAIGTAIAMSVVQGINASLKATIQIALQLMKAAMKELFTGALAAQMIGLAMGALFSSGFIQEVFIKMFKAMGAGDEAATIMTMVLMILIMLATVIAGAGGTLLSTLSSAVSGVKMVGTAITTAIKDMLTQGFATVAKNILQKIKDMIKEFISTIQKKIGELLDLKIFSKSKKAFDGIASTSKAGAQTAMGAGPTATERMLKRLIDYLKEHAMMPVNALKFITAALQVASQAVTADAARTRAGINKALAALERESIALEAVTAFLQSTGAISSKSTLHSLSESSKKMFDDWQSLCTLIAGFIMSISQSTTEFHQKTN